MGIDGMRVGGGRCPSLLVGGLLVACIMLTCNWWTLSTENLELLGQIEDLNEQLKISAEERDQCVTLRGNLEQRYKHMEDEAGSLKKRVDVLEDSLTVCKGELDSVNKLDATKTVTIETLRLERDALKLDQERINGQLKNKQDELDNLKGELEKARQELDQVKLTLNSPTRLKVGNILKPTRSVVKSKAQLAPIEKSSVRISTSGQRGLKFHGTEILARDPPGAVRLQPRLSVTMLKAQQNNLEETDKNVGGTGDDDTGKQKTGVEPDNDGENSQGGDDTGMNSLLNAAGLAVAGNEDAEKGTGN